jgi:type II secretory pathway pseudopilin PulG
MSHVLKILNNKGISLVEVMIAMLLTGIAVISILPMQDMSLRTAGRSDLLGRAGGIMQAELERRENQIMTTFLGTPVAVGEDNLPFTVSDLGGIAGDFTFNVRTRTSVWNLQPINGIPTANSWIVNVTVTWAGGPATGITSSIIVTNQPAFRDNQN